jgi:hypothetical protein
MALPLDWPSGAGPERSRRILEEIKRGNYELDWCPMELSDGTSTLRVQVSCDALKIGGVRVSASAVTQQLIADELGAVLLTPKLYDSTWLKTASQNRLDPKPQPITSSTVGTVNYSTRIDAHIQQKGSTGLLANVGKAWVITNKIFTPEARMKMRAANYGWILPSQGFQGLRGEASQSTPSLLVVQDIGTAHDSSHDDYSQVILLAARAARFGELPVDLADVYTGKSPGNSLVSHEGFLKDYRQPTNGFDDEPPTLPEGGSKRPSGASGRVVAGGALGATIGWFAAQAPGAAIGVLIGGILANATRRT